MSWDTAYPSRRSERGPALRSPLFTPFKPLALTFPTLLPGHTFRDLPVMGTTDSDSDRESQISVGGETLRFVNEPHPEDVDTERATGPGQLKFRVRPDARPVYSNLVNSATTQGAGVTGKEGELAIVRGGDGGWSVQPRLAGFYGITRTLTLGGDALGSLSGDEKRGAGVGVTARIGSADAPEKLDWWQRFGLISTLRANFTLGGTSLAGSFTGIYSLPLGTNASLGQLDVNAYVNPDVDKTSIGAMVQPGFKIGERLTVAGELGLNRDLRAPSSRWRVQGGLGLVEDTSASTVEKSSRSIYLEAMGTDRGPSVFLTFGGAFASKGFFF